MKETRPVNRLHFPPLARSGAAALLAALMLVPMAALPQAHDHAAHQAATQSTAPDARQAVQLPPPLREHTLANMRDHLLALAQIQEALSRADFDRAAETAETRLGMSSLRSHGAHEVGRYMPPAMQEAGTAMHRSASQFATVAKDASVAGDLKPALAALARLSHTCVACHAGYRFP